MNKISSTAEFWDLLQRAVGVQSYKFLCMHAQFQLCHTVQRVFSFSFIWQVHRAPWWLPVKRATWRHPEGPESTINGRYME